MESGLHLVAHFAKFILCWPSNESVLHSTAALGSQVSFLIMHNERLVAKAKFIVIPGSKGVSNVN